MPKFGLKCFLGSFIFSLVAVVAVTRGYFAISSDDENEAVLVTEAETKNIELFAANEENDPILEKYDSLTKQGNQVKDTETPAQDLVMATSDNNASEGILFAPQDDAVEDTPQTEKIADNSSDEDAILAAKQEEVEPISVADNSENLSQESELKIVDAAEAKVFEIPLVHSFAPANEDTKISNKAENNQIALAEGEVPLDNLGATSQPATQIAANNETVDDTPWEVAEVANKNVARNQNAEIPDNSAPKLGNSVPYRMQKNILIPIPDEIANDKNLTPQFSSSEENIKLEKELRRKRGRPSLYGGADANQNKVSTNGNSYGRDGREAEGSGIAAGSEEISEEESGSLTDSIAAWFSGGRKSSDKQGQKGNDNAEKAKSGQQESSLFRKLLGLGAASKDNIAPTELKLSFQPDRAEISGQTLEWIKAFSENVVKYDDVAIEIRLDRDASYELQQKRLNLLYKILANNGVEYRKINIIFTDREPNSFIIRNVRYVTKEENAQVAEKQKSPWY